MQVLENSHVENILTKNGRVYAVKVNGKIEYEYVVQQPVCGQDKLEKKLI